MAVILGATFLGVALTTSREDHTRTEKPRTTNILAPGAQVDPKDAWRGQADAQMKAFEQKSREMEQKKQRSLGAEQSDARAAQKARTVGLDRAAAATGPGTGCQAQFRTRYPRQGRCWIDNDPTELSAITGDQKHAFDAPARTTTGPGRKCSGGREFASAGDLEREP